MRLRIQRLTQVSPRLMGTTTDTPQGGCVAPPPKTFCQNPYALPPPTPFYLLHLKSEFKKSTTNRTVTSVEPRLFSPTSSVLGSGRDWGGRGVCYIFSCSQNITVIMVSRRRRKSHRHWAEALCGREAEGTSLYLCCSLLFREHLGEERRNLSSSRWDPPRANNRLLIRCLCCPSYSY